MDPIMEQIIELLKQGAYEFTEHAFDRMAEYVLDEKEVLTAIEEGFISKKQRDEKREARWVYTILGDSDTERSVYVAGKIVKGTFQVFRILTAKEDEG